MSDEQYPGNSFRDDSRISVVPIGEGRRKPENKEIAPVAKGKEKKKNFGQKFLENFFVISKDDIEDRLMKEWLIPGIKNMLEDAMHMILFGGRTRSGSRNVEGDKIRVVNYDKAYDRGESRGTAALSRRIRKPELIFETREDAEDVLRTLFEYLEEYHRATVKDLYALADMDTEHTMNNWGWTDLSDAVVVRVEDGYLLEMPKVKAIVRR